MERSVSPVHLRVGEKTPIHVHLKPKKKGLASSSSYGRIRSRYWGKGGSSNTTPWIPPPGRSTVNNSGMIAWESPTHRLDITPRSHRETGDNTVLRLSELRNAGTDIVIERMGSNQLPDVSKLQTLQAEIDQLKTEADLERSLRDLEETENTLRMSHLTLRDKDAEQAMTRGELRAKELESVRLSLDRVKADRTETSYETRKRESLHKKMLELDDTSTKLYEQANSFVATIRKLQKDRRFQSVYASDVAEQKDLLMNQLLAFQRSNKTLRRTLREQQDQELSRTQLSDQLDALVGQVAETNVTNQRLKSRLEESEKLASHNQILHDEIGQRDREIQELAASVESLEEQLRARSHDCTQLESFLAETKCKSQVDRGLLKKAAKLHMERAIEGEHSLETLGKKLEIANAELEKLNGKLRKSTNDEMADKAEIRSLQSQLKELQATIELSKVTCQSSVNAVSTRLSAKTQDLNAVQMENDHLRSTACSLQEKIRAMENTCQATTSSLESEIAELQTSVKEYETLAQQYKRQTDRVSLESDEKSRELQHRDAEFERARRERAIETEKVKLVCQQHLSEVESTQELLKRTESRLKEADSRMLSYEHQVSDQTKLIAKLNSNVEETNVAMNTVRDKWHESTATNKSMEAHMEIQEKRLQETEKQNRELMEIAGTRDSSIQKLQSKVEQLLCEVSSVSAKHEMSNSDHERQLDQVRDKAANKDRININRISELETQLSRANCQTAQLRKSKEESERRCQAKICDFEIRLEQANSSKRSVENYANFLKISYAAVFNDVCGAPGPRFSPNLH